MDSQEITLQILTLAWKNAHESILNSQTVHAPIKEAIKDLSISAENFSDLYNGIKTSLVPFGSVSHEPLHEQPIREQISKLIENKIPTLTKSFSTDDLTMLLIIVTIQTLEGQKVPDNIDPSLAQRIVRTTGMLLSQFKGAHRGRGYLSAHWALIVAQDMGVVSISDGILAQLGFSQGFREDLSLERLARDFADLKEFHSTLHWVSHKIGSFEVVSTDGRYKPLFRLIGEFDSYSRTLVRGVFDNTPSPILICLDQELCELKCSSTSQVSENMRSVNLKEFDSFASRQHSSFMLPLARLKRARTQEPDQGAESRK